MRHTKRFTVASSPRPAGLPANRRGVLLLVVLSMLTLFMLLGVTYLAAATRSRETAQAFARLTFRGDEVRVPAATLLDRVLMTVVRGGTSGRVPVSGPTVGTSGTATFESLLGDRYGAAGTLSGTATGFTALTVSGTATGVLSGTVSVGTNCRPTDLCGRILTFTEPGRPITSHRIIRAIRADGSLVNTPTNSFRLVVDAGWRTAAWTKPLATARVIINGREFAGGPSDDNEAYDGFDANNLFLAQVQTDTSAVSKAVVMRGSYTGTTATPFTFPMVNQSGTGSYTLWTSATSGSTTLATTALDIDNDLIPDVADNDNDGVADGVFHDFGLPTFTDAAGNTVTLRASVLVVDLDGRFNVNAHDCLPRMVYAGTTGWPTASSTSTPIGSGYGPAEIYGLSGTNAWSSNTVAGSDSKLFPGTGGAKLQSEDNTFSKSENPTLLMLTGGPSPRMLGTRNGAGTRYSSGNTQQLSPVEGKYGERAPADWTSIVGSTSGLKPSSSAAFAVPGRPGVDDAASSTNDRRATAAGDNYGVPALWWSGTTSFDWGPTAAVAQTRGVFNSPPDLHGRMRTFTGTAAGTGIVPQLQFAKAEWSGTSATDGRETVDDPYELRLDTRSGFGGAICDPIGGGSGTSTASVLRDNPFTPAELEPVLRPYDIDTNRLPPRLPAMLGSVGEEARLKVTTDSWDTTAITGTAALLLFGTTGGTTGWLQQVSASGTMFGTTPLSGIVGNEVARGERFDLNRPLAPADATNAGYVASSVYVQQRQAYFKDLYTLLVALNPSTSRSALAQWAANVMEFRDADSRVIPLEYDSNPANGWDVDGDVTTTDGGTADRAVVWGAERPELLINETWGWYNDQLPPGQAKKGNLTVQGMVITLHRPWNAMALGSGTTTLAAEPCDYAFDTLASGTSGAPQNLLNLGRNSGTAAYPDVSGTIYPVWRLRLVGSGTTTYIRFDTSSSALNNEFCDNLLTTGSTTLKMGVDSTLTLLSSLQVTGTVGNGNGNAPSATLTPSGTYRIIDDITPSGTASTTVYLERLSDPTYRLTPSGSVAPSVSGSTVWNADPLTLSATSAWPVRYVVVDSATASITTNNGAFLQNPKVNTNCRDTLPANAAKAYWGSRLTTNLQLKTQGNGKNGNVFNVPTGPTTSGSTAWLPWPNRPFVSAAELTLVPQGSQPDILLSYQRLTPSLSGSVGNGFGIPGSQAALFDAVHVPTRFAGIHRSGTNLSTLSGTTGIHPTITTVNQFSSFREPGRVNLNTVPSDDVWNAVVAGPLATPVVSATAARFGRTVSATTQPQPAKSMFQLLSLSGTAATPTAIVSDTAAVFGAASDKNPLHAIYTATRLANSATPRSNVYGVWVTLRESVASAPDSVRYRRAFYVVDRSVPVGFEPGRDHNVKDCIRVRRMIE